MWDFSDIYKKDQFAVSYLTLHEWYYKKQKNRSLAAFMKKNGYNNIALYSLGTLGSIFLEEFLNENLSITYAIDKNKKNFPEQIKGVPVIGIDEISAQKQVDAIVICHVYYYNQIADELVKQGVPENKIISLNDIVFSI